TRAGRTASCNRFNRLCNTSKSKSLSPVGDVQTPGRQASASTQPIGASNETLSLADVSSLPSPQIRHHPGLEIVDRRGDLELALADEAPDQCARGGEPRSGSFRAFLGGVVDIIALL